jgi:WXG100 family type VII secretion target
MSERIEANYDELASVENRFLAQAGVVEQMLTSLCNQMSHLQGGGWIGRGADAFYSEMEQLLIPSVQRLRQALEEASQTTRQVITHFENAEMEGEITFK